MNDDPLARYRLENHEVVHVPVHDRRERQAAQVVQLETQRPARQMHLVGDLDETPERDALQRHGVTAPQCVQVNAMAMVGGDHGQAGEPALGCLGLQDLRQTRPAADIQERV